MRFKLRHRVVFVVHAALFLCAVELVRRLPGPAQLWAAPFVVGFVAFVMLLLLLIGLRPGPRRDSCLYVVSIVGCSVLAAGAVAMTPPLLAPQHRCRLPLRLQAHSREDWFVTLFPTTAATLAVLLGANSFPVRCRECGKRRMIRAAASAGMQRKLRTGVARYWCVCCSTKMKTSDGVTLLDASIAGDCCFYDYWPREPTSRGQSEAAR
jgi:hypothetical protein